MNCTQIELDIFDSEKLDAQSRPITKKSKSKIRSRKKRNKKKHVDQLIDRQLELDLFNKTKPKFVWVLAKKIIPDGVANEDVRLIVNSEILKNKKNLLSWHGDYFTVTLAQKRNIIKKTSRLNPVSVADITDLSKVQLLQNWFSKELDYSVQKDI